MPEEVAQDELKVETVLSLDQVVKDIKALPHNITKLPHDSDKLHLLYKTSCSFMSASFHNKDNVLPVDSLQLLVDISLQLAVRSSGLLKNFIQMMPSVYRLECHSVNVSILSIFLGRKLGLQRADLQQLALAALIHDVGITGVDTAILEKSEKLDDAEFEKIKEHPKMSVDIASKNMIHIKRVLEGIMYHHENLDGSGYPKGLKGKEIPIFAQIIGICDAFDALTTDKVYRSKYSSFDALMLMHNEMKHHFSQEFIKVFIQLLHD